MAFFIPQAAFYYMAAASVASALLAVTRKNPVHSMLWVLVLFLHVAGIFLLGQFIEGNILQPKLVGRSVNLHPVWLMFALFAFGSLFGFVGLLLAVPAAAAVAVLVRFALSRYLESPMYRGHDPVIVPVRRPD